MDNKQNESSPAPVSEWGTIDRFCRHAFEVEDGYGYPDSNPKNFKVFRDGFFAGYHMGPSDVQAWQPIETAPKDGKYILIAEVGMVPDIASWCRQLPERTDRYGNKFLARPEGWFDVSRSRLHPSHWMPLPDPPA